MVSIYLVYLNSCFDKWEPDMSAEEMDAEDPRYIQVPIVIIDDRYQLRLERNWQYDRYQ